jgi:hypothetical protein
MTDSETLEQRSQIMKRLRRKVEVIRLDRKARNDSVYYDMNELLALLDALDRTFAKEVCGGDAQ